MEPPEGPALEQAEHQGTPWLAEHILVKIIDKRLQGGRCAPPLSSAFRGLTGTQEQTHDSMTAWLAQRLRRPSLSGSPG